MPATKKPVIRCVLVEPILEAIEGDPTETGVQLMHLFIPAGSTGTVTGCSAQGIDVTFDEVMLDRDVTLHWEWRVLPEQLRTNHR